MKTWTHFNAETFNFTEALKNKLLGRVYLVEFKAYGRLATKIGEGGVDRVCHLLKDMIKHGFKPLKIAIASKKSGVTETLLHEIFAERRYSGSYNEFYFKGGTEVFDISIANAIKLTNKHIKKNGIEEETNTRIDFDLPEPEIDFFLTPDYIWYERQNTERKKHRYFTLDLVDRFEVDLFKALEFRVGNIHTWFSDAINSLPDYGTVGVDFYTFKGQDPFPEAPLKGTKAYTEYIKEVEYVEKIIRQHKGLYVYDKEALTLLVKMLTPPNTLTMKDFFILSKKIGYQIQVLSWCNIEFKELHELLKYQEIEVF